MLSFFKCRLIRLRLAVLLPLAGLACSANKPAPPPVCDPGCQDNIALRGIREMLKLSYNLTVQGKPVGDQDFTHPCLPSGSVHVFGKATSNAKQGTTTVALNYDFKSCSYAAPIDGAAEQNYDLTLTGTVREDGTLAVQPSTTTAALLQSDDLTVSGTVYQPPVTYDEASCALSATQNGNAVFGSLCGRRVSFVF